MRRPFHKMHGLGNDFVIVDAREEAFDVTPALAKAIADRRTGVGCDQLIVLEPSDTADLRMRIWNSDGSEVESCGNATRCVVQLTGATRIESDGGLLEGETVGMDIEVSLPEPKFGWQDIPLAYAMDTNPLPMRPKPSAPANARPRLAGWRAQNHGRRGSEPRNPSSRCWRERSTRSAVARCDSRCNKHAPTHRE